MSEILLGATVVLLILCVWTLDSIRELLKTIDSKLDSLDNHAHEIDQNSDLLVKLETGQVRFNGEHFEDV